MSGTLGDNSSKWMELILSFMNDPSKYDLPPKVFELPSDIEFSVAEHLEYAQDLWDKIIPRSTNPFHKLDKTLPYWAVFTLPRRPAILYLAVWDDYWESNNKELHQEILYNFQELIQNFIRTELLLYKLVQPFRKRTGRSVLSSKSSTDIPDDVNNILMEFISPQKFLYNVAHFVRDRTIQSGIAYILLVERLSSLVSKTKNVSQLTKITRKFITDLARLKSVDFSKKIPPSRSKPVSAPPQEIQRESQPKIVEFSIIKLQEYDGYVEIQAESEIESRNFRIYDCIEEDLLREEMWKAKNGQSIYPLRSLISTIFEERYTKPSKQYSLKYGVEVKLLEPNWV